MGKDGAKMAEYLCSTCRYRNGDFIIFSKKDEQGIERRYTNIVRVNCTESEKYPGMVRAAPKRAAWMRPSDVCPSYRKAK